MADPNPVPASVGTSTISTLAIPPAEVVVGVTEQGRTLVPTEVHVELRQGSLRLTPTKMLVSVPATTLVSAKTPGSVFARFERVTPGTYTAHAERVDSGAVQAIADPQTKVVTAPHSEVDLFLIVPELTVTVTDTSSPAQTIGHAAVRASGAATLTGTSDASGVALFKPIPIGNYTVTASHASFEDGTAPATVTTTPSSVAVALKSRLEVRVVEDELDAGGGQKTVSAATVDISGPQAASATSDGSGVARFRGIVAGTYTIKASHAGYDDGTTSVVVPDKTSVDVKLARIGIEILERKLGLVSNGQEHAKIVGQMVDLTVRAHSAGHVLSEITWVLADERVKSYTVNEDMGVRTDLGVGDLTQGQVKFHWITEGKKSALVTAKVDGVPHVAIASFDVLTPTGVQMTSKTGKFSVGFQVGKDNTEPPDTRLFLNFGTYVSAAVSDKPSEGVGIWWSFLAITPVDGAGRFAGFQLIKLGGYQKHVDGSVTPWSSGGQFLLDTNVPYKPADELSGLEGGQTMHWASSDSPAVHLDSSVEEASLNDDFRVYCMYKSEEAGSIWVTLGLLEWHCRATVTRKKSGETADAWDLPMGQDASKSPTGNTSSRELPTWALNARSLLVK